MVIREGERGVDERQGVRGGGLDGGMLFVGAGWYAAFFDRS